MDDLSEDAFEAMRIDLPRHVDVTKVVGPLLLREAPLLLTNPYLPMEVGCSLSSEGMYHIAASAYMPNCTGEMIDWWFGWVTTTDQFKMWHPKDHVHSEWSGAHGNSTYIGGYHLIQEWIGEECFHLRMEFKDPSKYFGNDWREKFRQNSYETAICARIGIWGGPGIEATEIGHVIHLVRKEFNGVRVRSRYWLGDFPGVELPDIRARLIAEDTARGVLKHCTEKMATLASFLPDLYKRENGIQSDSH